MAVRRQISDRNTSVGSTEAHLEERPCQSAHRPCPLADARRVPDGPARSFRRSPSRVIASPWRPRYGAPPSCTARATSARTTARPRTASSAIPRSTGSSRSSTARRRGSTPAKCSATCPTASRSAPTLTECDRAGRGASRTTSSSAWRLRAACSPPPSAASCFDAIAQGMHIVNGLHEFLNDDPEFAAAARGAQRDDPRRAASAREEEPSDVQRAHLHGHLPAHRRAGHRQRHRQAHHRDDPRAGAQRPRHQGGPRGHRADRAHPGRALRRRARRHPLPVLLGGDGGGRCRGVRGRAPRRDRHRRPGRAEPSRLPVVDVHPAGQPAQRRHPAARAGPPVARRLPRRAHADAPRARSTSSRRSPTRRSSASPSTTST